MAGKGNSFWSTTSGVVTGVAGTLTGMVGIATMATQLGWVGSGGDDQQAAPQTTTSTGLPSTTDGTDAGTGDGRTATTEGRASRGAATTSAEDTPTYTVDPSAVSFRAIGGRTATVTVRNTGTVEVDVTRVAVEGQDEEAFAVDAGDCTGTLLDPGRSCAVEVAFSPEGSGATGGTLVVEVEGAPAEEVPLSGAALL